MERASLRQAWGESNLGASRKNPSHLIGRKVKDLEDRLVQLGSDQMLSTWMTTWEICS